jgi:tetratricopeptide (TPR) repeat protein
MKLIQYILIVIESFWFKVNHIHTTNQLKLEANHYYKSNNYPKALEKYYTLVNTYQLKEEEILYNLATCYFLLGNIETAQKIYRPLCKSNNNIIKANSLNQTGVLWALQGNKNKAIVCFKTALKANSDIEESRFNLELIQKNKGGNKDFEAKKRTKVSKNEDGNEAEIESETFDSEQLSNSNETDLKEKTSSIDKGMDKNEDQKLEQIELNLKKTRETETIKALELLVAQERVLLKKYHLSQTRNKSNTNQIKW